MTSPCKMRVHHVAISTTRLEHLVAFYVEKLGLTCKGSLPDEFRPEGFERRGWQHLAWEVPDVDAAYADLVARGVKSYRRPEDFPPDDPELRIAFLLDPDGNVLELVQELSHDAEDERPDD